MTDWTTNTIMLWDGAKVSDHSRSEFTINVERIGDDKRMIDGTMRRSVIANKKTWNTSWNNLPSAKRTGAMPVIDGGMAGYDMEQFYYDHSGAFIMTIRRGSAINRTPPANPTLPYEDDHFYIARVMFEEFSLVVKKRGQYADLVDVTVSLVEV